MKRDSTVIAVRSGDEPAGELARTVDGCEFRYEASFLKRCQERGYGVGFSVPITPVVETRGVNLHPFFAGLLPEGARLRALERAAKTSPDDLFGLLTMAGREAIGDVVLETHEVKPVTVDLGALDKISFSEVLDKSLDYARTGESRLLPGVQPKVSAAMMTLPVNVKRKAFKEALLKLETEELPQLVDKEQFFMTLAKRAGISAANTQVVVDREGAKGLLVERFDRLESPPHRLHVEDGCQILARYPADKYRLSFAQVLEGIARYATAPAVELAKALQLLVYSYLIANGDLHARNLSLWVTVEGRVELAPAYDLLSTLPYKDQRLALKVEGRDKNVKRRDVLALAARFKLPKRRVDEGVDEICETVKAALSELETIGLPSRQTMHLRTTMEKRLGDLA